MFRFPLIVMMFQEDPATPVVLTCTGSDAEISFRQTLAAAEREHNRAKHTGREREESQTKEVAAEGA